MMSSKDKNSFFPGIDFNGDGQVDIFESGLFFHMMQEEDEAISKGKGLFGSVSSSISIDFGSDDDEDEEDDFEDDEDEVVELDRDYSLDATLQEYQHKIDALIDELQQILDEEEEFVDDGYDKYGETDRYEQAENIVNNLGDAISSLEDASFNLGMAGA